jgi:NADH-quinone oxidoreductase subunit N
MMFASSANDFTVLFVSIELIAVTFYVLTSFQRNRQASLEAGVKYLILGAVASAFLIYGIALIYGTSGTMAFDELAAKAPALRDKPIFLLGLLLVLAGLGFKIAAFPFQVWAPDVYQERRRQPRFSGGRIEGGRVCPPVTIVFECRAGGHPALA